MKHDDPRLAGALRHAANDARPDDARLTGPSSTTVANEDAWGDAYDGFISSAQPNPAWSALARDWGLPELPTPRQRTITAANARHDEEARKAAWADALATVLP